MIPIKDNILSDSRHIVDFTSTRINFERYFHPF